MNRKFFIGSVGEPNKDYTEENRKRCISLQAHVMHKDTFQKGVFEKVTIGDICFLKYNSQLIAFGEVNERVISTDKSLDGWTYLIKVNKWYFYDEKEKKKGVDKYGISNHTMSGAGQMGTIKEIDSDYGLLKMKEISGENNELYKKVINEFIMDTGTKKTLNILEKNKNLILTGAPGTGKTYLAKKIAQQMIFGEVKDHLTNEEQKQYDEQCGFVQFHPSYDYTDFVEGLRPVQDDNDEVEFKLKDGIFKIFCAKALKNYLDSKKSTKTLQQQKLIHSLIDEFIQNAIDDGTEYQTATKNVFRIIGESDKRIKIFIDLQIKNQEISIPKKDLIKLLEHEKKDLALKDIKDICGRKVRIQSDSYIYALYSELNKRYENKKNSSNSQASEKLKNFVFIIDEINRGETSKIFGELFFSIDPGYRGAEGKVRTQYANMQTEEPNDFDDALEITDSENYGHFFVPENVYIIGTMNDIDRSVESMDFAFRRRFAFMEITAEDSKKMLDSDEAWGKDADGRSRKPSNEMIKSIKSKMDAINSIIWHKTQDGESEEDKCIEGLSSAYHIGASYFLKLTNYQKEDGSFDFDQLWDNHLEGLLYEYLRGMSDVQEKIKKLAKAFGYSTMAKYE